MGQQIKGGYYIKARCIQESEIATAPPHIRETWDWLLKEANHSDNKRIKRGSLLRTAKDIQEGLKWFVGYRTERYKISQCENSMKYLRKRKMITVTRTAGGSLITICNYDRYQDPKNYESRSESDNESRSSAEALPKHKQERKESNKKEVAKFSEDSFPYKFSMKLYKSIKTRDVNFKKPNIQAWCKHADLMERLDNRPYDEIVKAFKHYEKTVFWHPNILSTRSFRKNLVQLINQASKNGF